MARLQRTAASSSTRAVEALTHDFRRCACTTMLVLAGTATEVDKVGPGGTVVVCTELTEAPLGPAPDELDEAAGVCATGV